MKPKLLPLLTLAAVLAALYACNESDESEIGSSETSSSGTTTPVPGTLLDICPTWSPGDHRDFDLIKTRDRSGGDDNLSRMSAMTVKIEVTRADNEDNAFAWTFGKADSALLDGMSLDDAKAFLSSLGPPV